MTRPPRLDGIDAEILHALRCGACDPEQLAVHLSVPPSEIGAALGRLARAGLVWVEADVRYAWGLTDDGEAAVPRQTRIRRVGVAS